MAIYFLRENLSKISGIGNDRGRIAARSGLGAVMGSKKLKMLVLKGNNKVSFNNKNLFLDLVKRKLSFSCNTSLISSKRFLEAFSFFDIL